MSSIKFDWRIRGTPQHYCCVYRAYHTRLLQAHMRKVVEDMIASMACDNSSLLQIYALKSFADKGCTLEVTDLAGRPLTYQDMLRWKRRKVRSLNRGVTDHVGGV